MGLVTQVSRCRNHCMYVNTEDANSVMIDLANFYGPMAVVVDCTGVESSEHLFARMSSTLRLPGTTSSEVAAHLEGAPSYTIILNHVDLLVGQPSCLYFLAWLRGNIQMGMWTHHRWVLLGKDIGCINDAMIHGGSNPTFLWFHEIEV